MNHTFPHCFLLDGKTIHPINQNYQLYIPLKILNNNNNNNKYCQVDEQELGSCALEYHQNRVLNIKQNSCKHYQSNQNLNNIETYLITRIISSICNKELHKSSSLSSPFTIIIKPDISSENHQLNKHKNSSSSSSSLKRLSNQHRLSTFKDILRRNPTAITINKTTSSHILNSRRLLDIYRNKKQNIL